jgi:hypothetical protein
MTVAGEGQQKIVKPPGQEPDEFEIHVANELFNLQVSVSTASTFLSHLCVSRLERTDTTQMAQSSRHQNPQILKNRKKIQMLVVT